MSIEIIISSAIVSAVIAAIGTIVSAKIAQKTAKETAKQEMNKLRKTWEHDDEIIYDQAFHEMVEAVTHYMQDSSWTKQELAKVKTMNVLSLSSGDMAERISNLYDCLKYRPAQNAEDRLKEAIICKQKPQQYSKGILSKFLFK